MTFENKEYTEPGQEKSFLMAKSVRGFLSIILSRTSSDNSVKTTIVEK
jgi:hypothetical protein